MKNIITPILTLIISIAIKAQTLSPWVIASTGGFSFNGGNSLSYTVGEMTMVQTFSSHGNILTQGFQQPNDITTGLIEINGAGADMALYPNPAADKLWFTFQFGSEGQVTFTVTSISGQKIAEVYRSAYAGGKVSSTVDASVLASGTYFLAGIFTKQDGGNTSTITRKFEVAR